jgi:hypothetical protein
MCNEGCRLKVLQKRVLVKVFETNSGEVTESW